MRPDLRLVAPAVACWIAAGVLISMPERVLGVVVVLWLSAVTFIGIMVADRRPRWRTVWGVLGIGCAGAALVASVIAMAEPVRLPDVVREAADHHSTITGMLTVWSMPLETQSFGGFSAYSGSDSSDSSDSFGDESSRVRFRGTLTEFELGPDTFQVSTPVVVFAELPTSGPGVLRIGSIIRLDGTLKTAAAGDAAAALFFSQGQPDAVSTPPWWLAWADDLRAQFSDAAPALAGDGGDLLPGLAIGDTSAVSDELDSAMKVSSLSHLTAVSGANCAIVIASIMLLGGYLRLRRAWRIGLSLVVLLGFVVLVTPEPSVLRAAVMASVVMLGAGMGRPGRGVPALLLVVIALLVTDPWLSRNYGFALSVLATAGLLLLSGPLTRALSRWMPTGLAAVISIPLAAQLACQPVLVLLSPSIPLYGVPANLLAAPAAPVATVIGLAACLLLPWLPGIALGLLYVAWAPAAWIAAVAQTTAVLPGSRLPWLGGVLGVVTISALTLVALALVLRRKGTARARWPAGAFAVLLAFLGAYTGSLIGSGLGRAAGFPADWQIAACDIGQGDAVIVRDDDLYALVDVGPDPKPLAACLRTLGISRIDLLVLTHYDMDHIGGIDAVIGMVDSALVGAPENDRDEQLHERLADGGAMVREAARGDTGRLGRLRWEILWPKRGSSVMQTGNEGSVTIGFDGRGIRSLFLGDLGEEPQNAMRSASKPGKVDVVKVAHHGSGDQSPELYATLGATVGLISVGADNGYGHPTDKILDILANMGTVVVRTDRQGMAVIALAPEGGGALTVWTEKVQTDTPPMQPVSGPD